LEEVGDAALVSAGVACAPLRTAAGCAAAVSGAG